ncbi:MAG: hypothetical protein Q7J38_12500 [Gallionella sp.]|nr:hypothetical protein [Gallionella sp.]
MKKYWQLFLLGVGMVAPLPAWSLEDASQIEKRFEKPPEPKSTLQPLIFPISESLSPAQTQALRFTLKELTIKGYTSFSVEELAPLYTELIGKEVTLLDIYNS